MTLTELIKIANDYTDENITQGVILGFANVGISRINTSIGSKLPLFTIGEPGEPNEYTALSRDWLHVVVIPYVCWSIKMNDSSLNEADAYLSQFYQGLEELRKNKSKVIPELYQGEGFNRIFKVKQYTGMW